MSESQHSADCLSCIGAAQKLQPPTRETTMFRIARLLGISYLYVWYAHWMSKAFFPSLGFALFTLLIAASWRTWLRFSFTTHTAYRWPEGEQEHRHLTKPDTWVPAYVREHRHLTTPETLVTAYLVEKTRFLLFWQRSYYRVMRLVDDSGSCPHYACVLRVRRDDDGRYVIPNAEGSFMLQELFWLCQTFSCISLRKVVTRLKSTNENYEYTVNQRDALVGALVTLKQLVTEHRDTFANSPYGALIQYYITHVLRQMEGEETWLSKLLLDHENELRECWEPLAQEAFTQYGRR